MADTSQNVTARLHDVRVHVRLRIAALWTAIMFLYIYNDVFSLYVPGALQKRDGGKDGRASSTSPPLLLGFSASMIPACLMVFLPLVLPAAFARRVSVGAGLFHAVFVGWTLSMPDAWSFYILLGAIEIALSLLSAWYAWTWPRLEAPDSSTLA
jgi:hypothetical protein